jgi:sugar phosphate isomerase/epimerase
MIVTLHGLTTMHSNLLTDIRIARETDHTGLEILESKLHRYIDQGNYVDALLPVFEKYQIKPVAVNGLRGVEVIDTEARQLLFRDTERICSAAEILGVPTVQILPLCSLEGRPWKEVLELTAENLVKIAKIGLEHGIRFQLEPVAWSPIHSLWQSLALLQTVGCKNIGMVIDFWHLWAGGETHPSEVAKLDSNLIYGIHFCDGKKPAIPGGEWDEAVLRSFLPGEGGVPILDWVNAVKATGYDGSWSAELFSPKHWEWDLKEIANRTREIMEGYIF